MKKALLISSMALLVLACHRKTGGGSSARKEEAAHAALVTEGKTIYTTKCTKCHGAKPVENFTAQRWEGILKSMVPRAKLNETETEQVTAYVMANAKK